MIISLRDVQQKEPIDNRKKSLLALGFDHNVKSLKALGASQKIRTFHWKNGWKFGFLGAEIGPLIQVDENNYQRDFELGHTTYALGENDPNQPGKIEGNVDYGVQIIFTGFKCFEISDSSVLGLNDHDEPYLIISVIRLNPALEGDQLVKMIKFGAYSKISSGRVFDVGATIYSGLAPGNSGIFVTCTVYDNDQGSPEEVAKKIEETINKFAKEAVAGLAEALGAGREAADAYGDSDLKKYAARYLSLGIVELFGLGDDEIGSRNFQITPKEIKSLVNNEGQFEASLIKGITAIPFNYPKDHQNIIEESDGSGKYQAYFQIKSFKTVTVIPDS